MHIWKPSTIWKLFIFAIIPPQVFLFPCFYSLSFNQVPTKPSALSITPILHLFSFPTSSLLPTHQSSNLSVSLSVLFSFQSSRFQRNTQQHQRKRINFRQSKTKTATKRRRSKGNQTIFYSNFDVLGPKMCPELLWPPRRTLLLPTITSILKRSEKFLRFGAT